MSENVTDDEYDPDAEADAARAQFDGMDDGCGCAEVWEHLSDERDAEAASD
ncbi:hypothetical protein [Natronomonas sp. EA1]|uniref:hypothetical protein n=1 Tax=Natronomonas sp. EA1 TaxID=3421655 RepID=UPI003EB83774